MWQQAALPHPPLQVSHGHLGDTLAGAGDGSEGDPQVDPPPPPNTYTQTNTPSITGFRHKSKSGRRQQRGSGGAMWMKEATLSKCRNQGQDREINLI